VAQYSSNYNLPRYIFAYLYVSNIIAWVFPIDDITAWEFSIEKKEFTLTDWRN